MPLKSFNDNFDSWIVQSMKDPVTGSTTNATDLFTGQGGPWHQVVQVSGPGGVYSAKTAIAEITDTKSFSGTNSAHFKVTQTELDDAFDTFGKFEVKQHLKKRPDGGDTNFSFVEPDIVSISQMMFLPSGSVNDWISDTTGNGPRWLGGFSENPFNVGWRLTSNNSPTDNNNIMINRLNMDGISSDNVQASPFATYPLDVWFKCEVRFKVGVLPTDDEVNFPGGGLNDYTFNADDDAWLQVMINNQIVFQRSMTTRGGTKAQTGTEIDNLLTGIMITSNTTDVYLDSVDIHEEFGPFTMVPSPPSLARESTTTTVTSAATNSFVMNMPATRPDDDWYIICVVADQGFGMGYDAALTPLADQIRAGEWFLTSRCFKRKGENEPASYTFTGTTQHWAAVVYRYSGGDPSDILDVITSQEGATPVNPTHASATPTVENSVVLMVGGSQKLTAAVAPVSGEEPVGTNFDFGVESGNPGGVSLFGCSFNGTKDVATGSKSWADSVADDENICWTIVLAPFTPPPSTLTLPIVQVVGSGSMQLGGTAAQILPAPTQHGVIPGFIYTATSAQALPAATQAGAGTVEAVATSAQVLPSLIVGGEEIHVGLWTDTPDVDAISWQNIGSEHTIWD